MMALGDKARQAARDRAAANRPPTVGGGQPGDDQAALDADVPTTSDLTRDAVAPDLRDTDRETDFSPATRAMIRGRSEGRCEAAVSVMCTGYGQQIHHRKLRRHGDHSAENGLDVCIFCHNLIHGRVADSLRACLILDSGQNPAECPPNPSVFRQTLRP